MIARGKGSTEKANEDTRLLCESYIKEDAFRAIADIIARIRGSHGHLGAQQEWLNGMCPPDP